MQFALQLDNNNFEDAQSSTEDPLLASLLLLPLDTQIAEASIALLRHHLVKGPGATNATLDTFDRFYPRTASSITNRKVLCALLGMDASNQKISLLQQLLDNNSQMASAVAIQHVKRTCEDLTLLGLVANALAVAHQPNDTDLARVLSLTPSENRTLLEILTENQIMIGQQVGQDTFSTSRPAFVDHTNNALEVNGIRIGMTACSTTSVVRQLDDLNMENHQPLGRGAGGQVLRAIHRPTGQPMAVKCIYLNDNIMAQVESELRILWGAPGPDGTAAERNNTPFLIRCNGVFYNQCTLYLAMEIMDGSLKDIVKPSGIAESVIKAIAFPVMHGLAYMHDNLKQLHRDIKPHNILFRRLDGSVKISDFGISSNRLETMNLNRAGTFCGTLRYMSPLVVESSDYGFEADLWSFGATLIELALGALPYNGDLPFAIVHLKNVPPRLPADERFSPEFQSFISDLCDPSGQPPRARDLLRHPWFKGMTLPASQAVISSL